MATWKILLTERTDEVTLKNKLQNKARNIQMLLLDVDGVLTDGTFIPDPLGTSTSSKELKSFHSRDGIGIVLAKKAGLKLGLISGRASQIVESRANDLAMNFIRLGVVDKLPALYEATEQESLMESEIAYMGDDLPDIPILSRVGLSATVANAPLDVRSRVDYVTEAKGGHGAVREFIEFILKSQDKLDEMTQDYLI